MTTPKYTYIDFANDIIAMLDGTAEEMTEEKRVKMLEKAKALLKAQETKVEYSATHKGEKKGSGASEDTKKMAIAISAVLSNTPMTSTEIGKKIGEEVTPLQVSNACRFIPNVKTTKVIRSTKNAKGLTAEREYTAYYI
ncbi:MAG: hypothetical protein KBT46_00385 [Ruminococcus sp.]|nr:hypothetical protein [Candidatus Copronaster equi]